MIRNFCYMFHKIIIENSSLPTYYSKIILNIVVYALTLNNNNKKFFIQAQRMAKR